MIETIIDENGKEFILIRVSETEFKSMAKGDWEAQEAAKENGTIS